MVSYQVKSAKNGLKVPVVDGVYLHSIYDPLKESSAILEPYLNILQKKSKVLVLGLGYGYHVQGIIDYFLSSSRSFQLVVIEPNQRVVEGCLQQGQLDVSHVEIFCRESVGEIFAQKKLIDFLLDKPVIITHAPSFSLHRDYFTSFLTYQCPQSLGQTIVTLVDEEVKNYFKRYDPKLSLIDCFECIERKGYFEQDIDYALAAFGKL